MTDATVARGGLRVERVDCNSVARTDPRVVRILKRTSRLAGIAVTLLGMIAIAGWFAGLTALTSLSSKLPSMKFDTACALVLVGLSIVSLGHAQRPRSLLAGQVAAVGYGLLGLAVLVEDLTRRSFGIDNPFGFVHVAPAPGRISATGAACLVATAVSVIAVRRRHSRFGQLTSMFVVAVGSVAVVGYSFGVSSLYTVGPYSAMALGTAIAFLVAGLGILFVRCDEGVVALLTESTAGGLTVRRMLVPVVAGPGVVGGLLDWAARSNVLTPEFRLAIFTVSMILLSTTLVWIIGSSLRHVDLRRAGAEVALDRVNEALSERNRAVDMLHDALSELQSSEDRFRASVEHLHESLSIFSAIRDDKGTVVDFRWEFANAASSAVTGYSSEDLVGQTLLTVLPGHGPSGMLATYCIVVETGVPYVEPSLWYEDVWGDGRRRRRAFDVHATRLDDGFVVVTREVTEEREQQQELARQRQELERSNTEVKLLNALGEMLQTCVSADEAYELVAQSCAQLFSGLSGSISVMHPSRDVLEIEGRWGSSCGADSFAPADCWALRRGRPHISDQVGPRCAHLVGSAGVRCLCVPMVGQSETLGVVHLISASSDNDFSPDDDFEGGLTRQLAITVAGQMAMAFANLHLRDSLREMSIRDPLTGLFNRRYMEETLDRELGRAARDSSEVGIVMIDVDHFKAVNDTYGHEAGDAILEAIGETLICHSRTSDIACRMGGEEFVMILPGCSVDDARLRAEELRRRVSDLRVPYRNIDLSGPTISCGVVAFPFHGDGRDELIRSADAALYRAKKAGRDQVVVASLDYANSGDAL